MAVAKRQKKEKAHKNGTRENLRTRVRTQVKQTALLASPIYTGQAQAEEESHIKRRDKIGPLVSLLFQSFGSTCPHTSSMYFPLLAK